MTGGEAVRSSARSDDSIVEASSRELTCCAILFDLDGVLVDSTECIAHVWSEWATRRGLDPAMVRTAAHGRRAGEVVRLIAPELDATVEDAALEWAEVHATEGLRAVPGAGSLLASLPAGSWAVVTSALGSVATHRLLQTGLRVPPAFVVAEEVARGKPDPEGYLTAAARLGVDPADCLAIEDASAGIEAAHAAGMRAIGIRGVAAADLLDEADAVVEALADIHVDPEGSRLRVTLPSQLDQST